MAGIANAGGGGSLFHAQHHHHHHHAKDHDQYSYSYSQQRRGSSKDHGHQRKSTVSINDLMAGALVGFALAFACIQLAAHLPSAGSEKPRVVTVETRQAPAGSSQPEPASASLVDAEELEALVRSSASRPDMHRPPSRMALQRDAPRLPAGEQHDVRYFVDITAVETEPVEPVDLTLPGAGGNQPCAEGGADILPGWVCVKRNRLERRPDITPEELMARYYKQAIPFILTDSVVKQWKVFTEDAWAPEKLRERFKDATVNVQMGRESDPDFEIHQNQLRQEINFADYVDKVLGSNGSNDMYITANNHMLKRPQFQSMIDDIRPFFPGFMAQNTKMIGSGTYYWLGPNGTITPLHQDATSLFHVHMKGRKLWRFISPDQKQMLYNNYGVYSDIDLLVPWDELLEKYPLMAAVNVITEVIQPGEVVFVPNGWFHHVICIDHPTTSMSTAVWLPEFRPLETHVHQRWNSLYKKPTVVPQEEKAKLAKGLRRFISSAKSLTPEEDHRISTLMNDAMAEFEDSFKGHSESEVFQSSRKQLLSTITNNPNLTGALLWVLAHEEFNRMPAEWRSWTMTNIVGAPIDTIVQVMLESMEESQDTWGIVDSWYLFLKSGQRLQLPRKETVLQPGRRLLSSRR